MSRYREEEATPASIISDLHSRMSKRDRAPQLVNATVAPNQALSILGDFRVFGSEGQVVVIMGSNVGLSSDVNWALLRSDGGSNSNPLGNPYGAFGSYAIILFGPDATSQNLWLLSKSGMPMLVEDANGYLMALPEVPYDVAPSRYYATPPESTTSATYTALWTVVGEYNNPKLRVLTLVQTSDGTTGGNIRLRDPTTGVVFDTQSIPLGEFAYHTLSATFPVAGYAPPFKYDVEIQRTAGAGSIRAFVAYAVGYGDLS